jgi:hypothetical protein
MITIVLLLTPLICLTLFPVLLFETLFLPIHNNIMPAVSSWVVLTHAICNLHLFLVQYLDLDRFIIPSLGIKNDVESWCDWFHVIHRNVGRRCTKVQEHNSLQQSSSVLVHHHQVVLFSAFLTRSSVVVVVQYLVHDGSASFYVLGVASTAGGSLVTGSLPCCRTICECLGFTNPKTICPCCFLLTDYWFPPLL